MVVTNGIVLKRGVMAKEQKQTKQAWKQFRVTPKLKKAIEDAAEEQERTESALIRLAVKKYLGLVK